MNRWVILILIVCVVYAVEGRNAEDSILKVKREVSVGSRLLQDSTSKVHTRERRAPQQERNSFFFLDNRSDRVAQLWYRNKTDPTKTKHEHPESPLEPGDTREINTYDSYEWTVIEEEKSVPLMINDKMIYTQKSNNKETRTTCIIQRPDQTNTDIGDKYMEVLIVLDKSVRDRFATKREARKYVKVVLKLASQLFQHETMTQTGIYLHLVATKVVFLDHELKFEPKKRGNNLNTACDYMNRIGNTGTRRFDHKIFFTRNAFGAGGFARKYGMCSSRISCSMVHEHGFSTAFMIAHEIGHSLGMSHGDWPQYSRYLLAEYIDSSFKTHRWSTQSQQSLMKYIRKYECLNNKPTRGHPGVYPTHPGQHYTFTKQCVLEFGESYKNWTWGDDPCKKLRCEMPAPYSLSSKSPGSPPLDGTECGIHKWCIAGKCTLKKLPTEIDSSLFD